MPSSRNKAWAITLFILKRLGLLAIVLWGVVTVLFFIMRLSGDPAELFAPQEATPEQIEALRVQLGLDGPVWQQYLNTLAGAARLDFGDSFAFRQDAFGLILERMGPSLTIILPTLILMVVLAFITGIYAALNQGRARGRGLMTAVFVLDAVPYFIMALLLVLILAVRFQVLPASGNTDGRGLIIPVVALAIGGFATLARLVRGQMIDALGQTSVQMARSKGIAPARVLFGHALPLAMPPLVSFIGMMFSFLLGSLIILETMFNLSGVGALLVRAVQSRDFALVTAAVFFMAFLITIVNMLAEFIVTLIDPRLRTKALA
ncbi:ABC transporter permease [uncultured Microbacterium sp.]|uniref:ABC transporter permease n=1 Tax=uncultured Microbacterium sp. TaxID=191216 RepID=UPI0026236785|nr:ABC transporter permease [uncultured Microbacterium sp.]